MKLTFVLLHNAMRDAILVLSPPSTTPRAHLRAPEAMAKIFGHCYFKKNHFKNGGKGQFPATGYSEFNTTNGGSGETGVRYICPRERQKVSAPTLADPWLPKNFEGGADSMIFHDFCDFLGPRDGGNRISCVMERYILVGNELEFCTTVTVTVLNNSYRYNHSGSFGLQLQ